MNWLGDAPPGMVRHNTFPRPIALTANSSWNIVNFRSGLIRGLRAAGHEVLVIAPDDGHGAEIAALGARFVPIAMQRSGLSPLADLRLLAAYRRLLRRHRPAALLGFTVKPNIYGSLAARGLGVATINNISGLGTAFLGRGPLRRLVSALYRHALRGALRVFFQNGDDRDLFVGERLVNPDRVGLLPGSGVDLDRFAPPPARADRSAPRFLLVARMLRDKGVVEFVEAARQVRAAGQPARFALLGPIDPDNRSAIARDQVDRWVAEGVVDYWGESADVRPFLARADCVVLPSYREGLPRSLLEAAAMARPLIATDVPGCRDVVRDGQTGLLCQARSAPALADAMQRFLALSVAQRDAMGAAARRMAVADFGEERVVQAYLRALELVRIPPSAT